MSLEQRTKDFMLEGDFDRDKFVKTGKVYQDIGKWIQTIQKDSTNPDVMKKAGKTFYDNPSFYYQSGTNPRPRLEDTFSVLQDNRAEYAKEKYSKITEGFEDKQWLELVSSLPLYKNGDKSHDEIVDAINEKRQVDEASSDPEKIIQFLSNKSKKFDDILRLEFQREVYNERYLKTLFGIYQRETSAKIGKMLYDENGDLKKGLAKKIFENSLHSAELEMVKETDKGDKNDIWESDIRPYYLALANLKYKVEKKKIEEDKEEDKEDFAKERAKTRKEKGMSIY